MLEKYYLHDEKFSDKQWKRLIAVQAALEVAKESVKATTASTLSTKVGVDLQNATKNVEALADAIQSALEKE